MASIESASLTYKDERARKNLHAIWNLFDSHPELALCYS